MSLTSRLYIFQSIIKRKKHQVCDVGSSHNSNTVIGKFLPIYFLTPYLLKIRTFQHYHTFAAKGIPNNTFYAVISPTPLSFSVLSCSL